MDSPRRARLASLCAAAVLATGCAHSPAPRGWLPRSDASVSDASGGWFRVERPRLEGELIAVEADSIFVLAGDTLVGVPKTAIVKATAAGYDIQAGGLGAWTMLGTISTLSHGVDLIFSAPAWLVGGGIATSSAAHAPLLDYPKRTWEEIASYARFPQGFPPALDRSKLRRKMPLDPSPRRRDQTMK